MNPPERYPPDDPREWLNRARSNLALARNSVPGAYLEDLCFEAQQAAEKAIKGVMISRQIEFPYVHDLALLLWHLEESGVKVPETVRRAATLTPYAVDTRYPGVGRDRRGGDQVGGGATVIPPSPHPFSAPTVIPFVRYCCRKA